MAREISRATQSRLCQKGQAHGLATQACWWEMLLLSLAVIQKWRTRTPWMMRFIFSIPVSACYHPPLDRPLIFLLASRQWSRALPPGPRPEGRYGHSLNILGSKIYIFGGQVEGCFFNDLIAYDLNALQNPTNQWEFLLHNTEQSDVEMESVPPARTNHSIVSYNDQLYL